MPLSCLGLGANLGYCVKTLQEVSHALSLLSPQIELLSSSSIYTTPPYQGGEQSTYYNLALLIQTFLTPDALLTTCLEIETQFGRTRTPQKKWEPRTIDIDILYYGSEVICHNLLQIPHYDIANRSFFLKPLCEITPEWQDPILGCSVSQLWEKLLSHLPQQQIPQQLVSSTNSLSL